MKRIVLLGPPGAGKGTQASALSKALGVIAISTGDLLRQAVSDGTELGRLAGKFINRGELVPDDIILKMVRQVIAGKEGYILDGFPRTVDQMQGLNIALTEMNQTLDRALLIDVPGEELVKRLAARRVCASCKAVYNLEFKPPEKPGLCDACGSQLSQRSDDRPATIRHRQAVYWEQTEPLVSWYEACGLLSRVDGTADVNEVTRRLLKAVSA